MPKSWLSEEWRKLMKRILVKSITVIDRFNTVFGKIISYAIYIMFVCILFEVFSRYALNKPTIWANELSVYLFGALGVLAGAFVLTQDQHIRIDILYSRYSPRTKAIVNCITVIFIIFWACLIIYYGWPVFLKTFMRNELSITAWRAPLWPIRLMIPVGGILLIVAAVSKLLKSIFTFITREEI